MSENGTSTNGNNWTLLTPEVKESGAKNMSPVTEGLKVEEQLSKAPEPSTLAHSDLEKHSSDASAHQPETETSAQIQSDPALSQGSEKTQETQITPPETSEARAQLNAAHVNEGPSSVSVEDISSWSPDHEDQDALAGHSESPACPGTDAELFSDSYSHISPTTGSSPVPASVCKERDHFKSDEETLRKSTGEEPKEVLETNGKEGDGLRKRKISHLGSLDKTEIEDDEEKEEEDFQPPQREEETVFTLNKCIIAAIILLGLGTIFFSGVLMDADDEADVDVRELKDPPNQDWLNLEDSRDTPVGLQPPDILSKHTKDDQQILALQAQLQQYQGELKAAQLLAETGEKERERREELEKEYQRIKGELDRLPALQKELEQENERMKEESARAQKELEALPSLQSELEHLRAQVSQLTVKAEHQHPIATSRTPPAGDKRDVPPIERPDIRNRKTWDKKTEEKEQSKADKEWKKKKSGKKEGDKDRKEKVTDGEHTKEQKDRKKEEGKAGKQREEKREWKKDKKQDEGKIGRERGEKWGEKREWNDEKKGKKDKHTEKDDKKGNKQDWKDTANKKVKEEKERKQKDWKSDKHSGVNDHREGKENKKEEWKGKKEKGEGKHNEKKWKGDREEHAGKEKEQKHRRGKERESKKEEWTRDHVKEEKKHKAHHPKNELKNSPNKKEEKGQKEKHRNTPPDETSSHHHHEQQNYWTKQRERIQHYDDLRDHCTGVEDCARVEGLSPVHLHDFENLLQSYMNKLQEEQSSSKEELRKLVREFFNNGVFAHDQMPFSEFVEDVGDILEDMAEGEESDTEAEDSEEDDDDDDDDEMEDFEREAMEKFALPAEVKKVEDSSRKKR